MTKHYIDTDGNYMGGFSGLVIDEVEQEHLDVDPAWVEVVTPPEHGKQIWSGSTWETPLVVVAQARIAEIDIRLGELDTLSIRALRTKGVGRGVAKDDESLTTYEDEAELLRAERATLLA